MKSTGRQSYLHAKCDHPASLKKSIAYSQILRVKRICSTKQFTKRGYDLSSIETEIKKIKLLDRKRLPTLKITQKVNIKQTIWNHWSILKTNKALEKTFSVKPVIAFRKKNKTNLEQLIGGKTIQNKYKQM